MKRSAIWNPRSAFGRRDSRRRSSSRVCSRVKVAQKRRSSCCRIVTLESPRATVPRALEISLLRHLGRTGDARERAQKVHVVDPTSSFVRYELNDSAHPIPALWTHLGADANRVLDLVDQYLVLCGGGRCARLCWSGNIRRLNRR